MKNQSPQSYFRQHTRQNIILFHHQESVSTLHIYFQATEKLKALVVGGKLQACD